MRGREARGGPATGLPSASWSRSEPRSPVRGPWPCGSGRDWWFRAYLVGTSWQVCPFVAGTARRPGGSGRTWSFRAYLVVPGVPGQKFVAGMPVRGRYSAAAGWFRAWLVVPGVPGRNFVAGMPVRGRYCGAAGWFRAYLVVPGVPGVFGRTWSELRGRYARSWQVLGAWRGPPEVRQRVRGALVEARTTSCGTMSIGRSSSPSLGSSRSTQRRPSSAKSTCTVVSGGQKCFASGMSS